MTSLVDVERVRSARKVLEINYDGKHDAQIRINVHLPYFVV